MLFCADISVCEDAPPLQVFRYVKQRGNSLNATPVFADGNVSAYVVSNFADTPAYQNTPILPVLRLAKAFYFGVWLIVPARKRRGISGKIIDFAQCEIFAYFLRTDTKEFAHNAKFWCVPIRKMRNYYRNGNTIITEMVTHFAIPDLAFSGIFAIVITAVIIFLFIYLFVSFQCGYICTASKKVNKQLTTNI